MPPLPRPLDTLVRLSLYKISSGRTTNIFLKNSPIIIIIIQYSDTSRYLFFNARCRANVEEMMLRNWHLPSNKRCEKKGDRLKVVTKVRMTSQGLNNVRVIVTRENFALYTCRVRDLAKDASSACVGEFWYPNSASPHTRLTEHWRGIQDNRACAQ